MLYKVYFRVGVEPDLQCRYVHHASDAEAWSEFGYLNVVSVWNVTEGRRLRTNEPPNGGRVCPRN